MIFAVFSTGSSAAVIWLIVLVSALVAEFFTVSLTSIWFSAGALAALIGALLRAPVWLQAVLFILVSFVMLLLVRPLSMKLFRKGMEKTNVEGLIGKEAVVTEDISNLEGVGAAAVDGVVWTARMKEENGSCKKGNICRVDHIEGVKLILVESADHSEQKEEN